uniref:Mos1 transposase HTH domain-containing protein n=1 Tax=Octopus bimaculoides TaxID=37653 RepID=A0A0L8I6X2_OCTBM
MDVKNIRKWCREFAVGHTEIHDEERSRRSSIYDKIVVKLSKSCMKIGGSLWMISTFWFLRVLSEKLQYWKVCARWVPQMLTEDHKQQPTL